MTNLQSLSMFLTERLMLAAQDIYKAVEVTVTEYHDEISRSRQENELLKRRLLEAGIEFYPESQPGPSLSHGEACIGSDRKASDEEMQVKREVCAPMQEADVPQHQAPIPEEPVSPSQCFEAERRVEELFRLPTADNSTNSLLHAQQCMQIKEEISESKSGLRTEAFGESHSGSSTDPSSAVVTGHASGLENELDRISSMHKDPEHPLTNKLEFTGSNRPANYDHGVKDKELTQKRERISKPAKVGRERKMEAKMENSRACSKKQSIPEVLLLDEEQSLPTLFQVNSESISEKEAQLYHEASALYHGQPRAHQCVVCGRSFGSRGLLKVHLRVHSGERPYHCPYCDKNFRQSSHLSVHIRIHTGEKPYTCLSCGKRFSDRSACNRHVKAHFENS